MTTLRRPERLLTMAEAARALRASRATVYRRIASGDIPAVRLGGPRAALRVPLRGLQDWLYQEPEAADD
jgi:excisionase family DNA binding protein